MMNDYGMGLGMGFGWLGTIVILVISGLTISTLNQVSTKMIGRNRHELYVQPVGNRDEL